jgi:hypothetical protein
MLHKDPSQRLTLPEVKVRENNNKEWQRQKIVVKTIQKYITAKCEAVHEAESSKRTLF